MGDGKIKANTYVEWFELFGVWTQYSFPGKLRPRRRRWRRRRRRRWIPRAERIGLHGNHPKANPGYIRTYIYPCRGASATFPFLPSLFINLLPFLSLSTLPYILPSLHPELSLSLSSLSLPFCFLLFSFSFLAFLPSAITFLLDFFFYLHNYSISLFHFTLVYNHLTANVFIAFLPSSAFHFPAFTFLRSIQTNEKYHIYVYFKLNFI